MTLEIFVRHLAAFVERRHAEGFEFVELVRRGGEVARLDRSAHRFEDDLALEFRRQRGDRRVHLLEVLACLGPFALLGEGKRAPQLRIIIVAYQRIGEILQATSFSLG